MLHHFGDPTALVVALALYFIAIIAHVIIISTPNTPIKFPIPFPPLASAPIQAPCCARRDPPKGAQTDAAQVDWRKERLADLPLIHTSRGGLIGLEPSALYLLQVALGRQYSQHCAREAGLSVTLGFS